MILVRVSSAMTETKLTAESIVNDPHRRGGGLNIQVSVGAPRGEPERWRDLLDMILAVDYLCCSVTRSLFGAYESVGFPSLGPVTVADSGSSNVTTSASSFGTA